MFVPKKDVRYFERTIAVKVVVLWGKKTMYHNVTLRRVRVTLISMEKR